MSEALWAGHWGQARLSLLQRIMLSESLSVALSLCSDSFLPIVERGRFL